MIVRGRFAAESRLNIGLAVFMMFLASGGLFVAGPRRWISLGMECLGVLWVWRNLRYGMVELKAGGLVVQGYGRQVHLPLSELVRFDSIVTVRGAGHRREVLVVQGSNGEAKKFDCVHDRPGSVRMHSLVDELNYALESLRLESTRVTEE